MTNADKLAEALLPCPFCGGAADPKGWASPDGKTGPACDDCGATAESVEAWNRRAALAATPAAPAGRWISADTLSRMVEPVAGVDPNQPGWHRRQGWNDALRRAMDYAHPLAATPAAAPIGYLADEIYTAWRKVGADVCGLKWDAFVDALRAAQGKEAGK